MTTGGRWQCTSCETPLVGDFCHACGQRRIQGRLSVGEFFADVVRRVFRFDQAFAVTFWRMVRHPGRLADDYFVGRRAGILDPLQYFISSIFVQLVIAALTRALAPMVGRLSALAWLGQLGGVVAVKILLIFWMATIWRLLFRAKRANLAESYVFATYVFGTTSLLWAMLPLIDLLVPAPLGANVLVVSAVTLGIEVLYASYAIANFAKIPWFASFARVVVVMVVGYGLLAIVVGPGSIVSLLLPPMPPG